MRPKGESTRTCETSFVAVMEGTQALGIAERLLIDAHIMRERASFVCAPSALHLDPGDVITLKANGWACALRIEAIGYEYVRPGRWRPRSHKRSRRPAGRCWKFSICRRCVVTRHRIAGSRLQRGHATAGLRRAGYAVQLVGSANVHRFRAGDGEKRALHV